MKLQDETMQDLLTYAKAQGLDVDLLLQLCDLAETAETADDEPDAAIPELFYPH